jgi:hypothetical protein
MSGLLVPALADAGPDCDPCDGSLKVIVQRERKQGLTFWYTDVSYKIVMKSVRELCVVLHCVILKITKGRIPHERGAPVNAEPDCVKSIQSAEAYISGMHLYYNPRVKCES